MSSSADSDGADLRIVCGPTAAGKSAIAMQLAARHGLTIVSADSRQIYRGFDIGTAKPPADDRARVPHLGIDVADPGERWSAARFAGDAERWIAAAGIERTLVVGGTGFISAPSRRRSTTRPRSTSGAARSSRPSSRSWRPASCAGGC